MAVRVDASAAPRIATPAARPSHRVPAALFVSLVALAVYMRTMYPGLVLFGDSPKFQFVGRIWGTPHNPGYPLYIVMSHLFGLLPIGTLAYRINFMSAFLGAVAAGLMVLLVSRLTGRTWAGMAAGFGLAFGREFWSQAIVAEVYTLATALLLATLCCAVRWTQTRRTRDLLAAVLIAALAVGNHLTVVMFAPGLVALVVLTDWRKALRPRTVAAMAALIIAGLCQYLLIIYFTRLHPPYLESAARNLSELVPIVAGSQFNDRFGHFGWRELLTTRNALLFRILLEEAAMWGVAAAVAGVVLLARTRGAITAGLLLSALSVWSFVLGYDIADPQVFLIPVFVVVWIFAGVAAAALIGALASSRPRVETALGPGVAIAVALALFAANHRVNDHHRRTFETALMDAVFRALPDRAVVVWGAFSEQLMLQYKLFGEDAAAGRHITGHQLDVPFLKKTAAAQIPIFALPEARAPLAREGFFLEPVALRGTTLKEFLSSAARDLTVAIAGPGMGGALPFRGPSFPEMGGRMALFGAPQALYAAIGSIGGRLNALEAAGDERVEVRLEARRAAMVGTGGLPEPLKAAAWAGGAISYGSRDVISSPDQAVVATFTPEGTVVAASTLDPRTLRLDLGGDPALFRVAGVRECRDVANAGWLDISPVLAGNQMAIRVDNYRPFDSHLWLVVGRDSAASTTLGSASGPGRPVLTTESFKQSDMSLDKALDAAGLPANMKPSSPVIDVIHLVVNDQGAFELLTLDLGGRVTAAMARGTADLNNPKRLTVCAGESF